MSPVLGRVSEGLGEMGGRRACEGDCWGRGSLGEPEGDEMRGRLTGRWSRF